MYNNVKPNSDFYMQLFLSDDDPIRIKICGTEICSYSNKARLTCMTLIVYSLCWYPLLSCIVSLPLIFEDSCCTLLQLILLQTMNPLYVNLILHTSDMSKKKKSWNLTAFLEIW